MTLALNRDYGRKEFKERVRRLYAPVKAMGGCVKVAIHQLHMDMEAHMGRFSFHRARELWLGRAKPSIEEIDFIRAKDGVWCLEHKKAKPDLMERMHDKIDALYSAYVERREAKRARKDFMQRVAAE
jgi:hypothetical protein